MLKDIKVWKGRHTKNGREARVYVHTDGGREGCLYLTGNNWHKKGSVEGNLTEAEWQEARRIAVWDGTWHTVYENEMPQAQANEPQQAERQVKKNRYPAHCWLCGRWVEPGQGETLHVDDEDEAMYGFQAGWLVQCLDREGCQEAVTKAKAERERKHATEEAARAAWKALPEEERKQTNEQFWNEFFEATQYLT